MARCTDRQTEEQMETALSCTVGYRVITSSPSLYGERETSALLEVYDLIHDDTGNWIILSRGGGGQPERVGGPFDAKRSPH